MHFQHKHHGSIGYSYTSKVPEVWSTVLGEALKGFVLLFPTVLKICRDRFERLMASLPLCDGKSGDGTMNSLIRLRLSCGLSNVLFQCSQCMSF